MDDATDLASDASAEVRLPAPAAILRTLLAATAAIAVATAASVALGDNAPAWLVRLDASREATLGTWFTAALLALAGACAIATGAARRAAGASFATRWLLVGTLLLAMSADEVGQVHEMVAGPTMDVIEVTGLEGTPARAVASLVALVALGLVLGFLLPWFRAQARRTRRLLLIAGAVYFGSALVLEILTRLLETARVADRLADVLPAIEETCEMAGIVILIAALLPLLPTVRPPRAT